MRLTTLLCLGVAVSCNGLTLAAEQDDLDLLASRRVADLAQFPDPPLFDSVSLWVDSQRSDGTWEDVNYASGCAARK